jgi:hypothetical protein
MRYRDQAGSTRISTIASKKHVARLGKLEYVRGYVYRGTYGMTFATIVKGENGTARFRGFSWGYGGEGPHGLLYLLQRLGVDDATANKTAFETPWETNTIGEKWRIDLTPNLFTNSKAA